MMNLVFYKKNKQAVNPNKLSKCWRYVWSARKS